MPIWKMEAMPGGGRCLVCRPLLDAGLRHAFTLRPPSPPPASAAEGVPPGVADALGLAGIPIVRPVQVHGGSVSRPAPGGTGTAPLHADAVVVRGRGRAAAVATADCVAGVLLAPTGESFAVLHAGWRGTLAGVVRNSVVALAAESGAAPASFLLAMGPSIGRCCYEVGEEVAESFRAAFPAREWSDLLQERRGRPMLDIGRANVLQAVEVGLDPSRIYCAGICTACRGDLCFSYRVEGRAAGRMWAVAGLGA